MVNMIFFKNMGVHLFAGPVPFNVCCLGPQTKTTSLNIVSVVNSNLTSTIGKPSY